MSSTTPLHLAGLQELADQHYDVSVLALMQNDALLMAVEELEFHGEDASGDLLRYRAQSMLPVGVALQQMYFRRYAGLATEKVESLEAVASGLTLCAKNLEALAAKALATPHATTGAHAAAEHAIGERYAQLIAAAETLESRRVISVAVSERIVKLSERPDGPLDRFYDKAIALLNQSKPDRLRAVA